MKMNTNAILPINKPPGMSSFDVIRIARKYINSKIGHAGTLDVLAQGLLLLLIGEKTKSFKQFQSYKKEYSAVIRLGMESDTFDIEGKCILQTQMPEPPHKKNIEKVLSNFTGKYTQNVPPYSASKYKGVKLYSLARKGIYISKKKNVVIHENMLLAYTFPIISFRVVCSSGTYIRTLASDIGDELGFRAVLIQLTRTCIGPFSLKNAASIEELKEGKISKYFLTTPCW